MSLVRALFSRRWWWVTLVVVALMLVLARLGIWQLDRLAQRRAANAQLMAALAAPPIPLNEVWADYATLAPAGVPEDLANRDVTLTGTFDFDHQRVVKLQTLNDQPGVHLVTPLVLDRDGSPVAVLVDRGWIPDAEYEAGQRFDTAAGRQTITGYIALTETIRRRTADAVVPTSPNDEVFRVDIAALAQEMPYPLAPFYVKVAPAGDNALPEEIAKEIDLSEGPHLGYAIQWFIFSLGLGAGYVLYVNRSLQQAAATPHPPAAA